MLASPLVLVGADKGGVGKSTVTRLLIDFLQMANRAVRVYDTQAPTGALKRFYPDIAEIIDIRDVRHQARLVESLTEHDAVTIVDIKAGQLMRTLRFMEDVGLLDAASRGEARVLVLHLIGASVASLSELGGSRPLQEQMRISSRQEFHQRLQLLSREPPLLGALSRRERRGPRDHRAAARSARL